MLITLIVTASDFIYRFTTYQSDLRAEGNVLLKFQHGIQNAEALYFSASPNAAVHSDDIDQRTIGQMINNLTPGLKLETVDTGGIHAGVFKQLIQLIPADSPVKTVVVNMNYRSFGVGWIYSKLENSIQKQTLFYNNRPVILNRFLQGLNYYEALSDHERESLIQWHWKNDTLPFSAPKNNANDWYLYHESGDLPHSVSQLAAQYIKNFAFVLNEKNKRVQDFDEIVTICKEKNLKLVFVILPENIEEAEELVDKDLTDLMIANKNWLVTRYKNKGASVVDCFEAVADSCFIERTFPSEHYNQTGRMIISTAVANTLNR